MVRHFIGLKARLTWNGFRTDNQRKVGLPVATALLLWVGFWVAGKYLDVHSGIAAVDAAAAAEYLGWAALVGFLVWTTLPVIIFPLDENLDPQQMATLPVSDNQMVGGLTAASMVAPSVMVMVIVGFANARILADGWWVIPFATAVMILLFAVGAQLLSAAVSAILRNRRGRDLATFLIFAMAGAGFIGYRMIDGLVGEVGFVEAALSNPIMDKAWILPPVAAQRSMVEAASGDPLGALLFLALAIAGLAIFVVAWRQLIRWLTTTPREGSRPAARARRNGMATGPWGTILTLARKELRFYVRDPRQRLVWTGTVIFVGLGGAGAILGTTGLFDVRGQEWGPLVAPVLVLFVGLPIALNLFGWERNAASYLFVLPVKPRSLLLGKNLAVATALLLETAILTIILGFFTDSWRWVWLVPPLALSAVACQLAVGNIVSVVTPLRLPREGTDVFAQSTEQGCLAIASQTLSFFAIGLLLVPPVSAVVLTVSFGGVLQPWHAAVIALVWGAILYLISLWLAGFLLKRRVPEVLGWVQVV